MLRTPQVFFRVIKIIRPYQISIDGGFFKDNSHYFREPVVSKFELRSPEFFQDSREDFLDTLIINTEHGRVFGYNV